VKWASKKIPTLYRVGPYHNEPLRDTVLLYPQTIDRPTRETFLRDLLNEICQQTGQQLRVVQQRQYAIGPAERMGTSLLRLAAEVRSTNPQWLAVVILWDRLMANVHGELKEVLKPVLSQCVTERVVRNVVSRFDPQRATSQVRNLALAVLIESGVKPWVLADALHHDVHIGIDLLFGRVGYQFLYGTSGRLMAREVGEASVRGRMREAIKRSDLRKRLVNSLQAIVQDGHQARSIVIHRDGRWWPSESEALKEVVAHLKSDEGNRILPSDVRCVVLEIRKSHLPLRLFTVVEEGEEKFLQNPLPGSYLVLDRQRVLLTTTGRPGAWDSPRGRTAGALLVEVVESIGEIDIEHIAEDVYRLTHLNWNAPDIEIALPVTIRWADEALRETFRPPAKEEEDVKDKFEVDESDELADTIIDKEELSQ
jgi:hypothetical protein